MKLHELHWDGSVAVIHRAAQPSIYIGRDADGRFNILTFVGTTARAFHEFRDLDAEAAQGALNCILGGF